jgi:hypothetical protein
MHFLRRSSRLALAALSTAVLACSGGGGGASNDGGKGKDSAFTFTLPPRDSAYAFPADAGHDTGAKSPDGSMPRDASMGLPDVAGPPPPTDAEATTYPAFVPPAPQIQDYGGPVLTNPVFVPIIFAGDEYAAEIPGFVSAIGGSDYWKGAVSEYGVGAGTSAPAIVLDETLPAILDDTQLQVWLQNRIGSDPRFLALSPPDAGRSDAGGQGDGGHAEGGRADGGHADGGHPDGGRTDGGRPDGGNGGHDAGHPADAHKAVSLDANAPLSEALDPTATPPSQAIYIIFAPSGTNVTYGSQSSCVSYGGYHTNTTYGPNGSSIIYAVIPRCTSFNGLTGFDIVTGALSHELAEASTDPLPRSSPAYINVDIDHIYWSIVLVGPSGGIGEVGDLCQVSSTPYFNPPEAALSRYTVQRIWSNANAAAGHDPCQPALPTSEEPFYFNAVPKLSTVVVDVDGEPFQTLGLVAPPNVPTRVEVDLFSDMSTAGQDWSVEAYSPYNGNAADLVFTPATVMGSNGYKLDFTVTNLSNDGLMAHPFYVESSLGTIHNVWIGVVTDQ